MEHIWDFIGLISFIAFIIFCCIALPKLQDAQRRMDQYESNFIDRQNLGKFMVKNYPEKEHWKDERIKYIEKFRKISFENNCSCEEALEIQRKEKANEWMFEYNRKEFFKSIGKTTLKKDEWLSAVKERARVLEFAPADMFYDEDFCVEAIQIKHYCIDYMPNSAKTARVCYEVLKQKSYSTAHLTKEQISSGQEYRESLHLENDDTPSYNRPKNNQITKTI